MERYKVCNYRYGNAWHIYAWDEEKCTLTNEDNGKSVQLEKGTDVQNWLRMAGCIVLDAEK